jgi:hypothetical protein
MNIPSSPLRLIWSSVLVALGYITGIFVGGMISAILGLHVSAQAAHKSSLILLLIGAIFLGAFIGPLASRLSLSRWQGFLLWGSLILFNLGSVMIEGAYFAPNLVSIPVPMLAIQQFCATIGAALVITMIYRSAGEAISWMNSLQQRPWYSWIWRFIMSALSYLVFYFVIGGLNYQLVTKPYYETHVGGLTVPPVHVVLVVESIRAALIVFSVFLFVLSARGTRRQLMVSTGWLLFAIGGIIPLIWEIGSLPLFLLAASAVEICFQNFFTGVIAARLLGLESKDEVRAPVVVKAGVV